MKIKTKFDIGDMVWFPNREKDESKACRRCGYLEKIASPFCGKIEKVKKEDYVVRYYYNGESKEYYTTENLIFKTEEECQKACDKLNEQ